MENSKGLNLLVNLIILSCMVHIEASAQEEDDLNAPITEDFTKLPRQVPILPINLTSLSSSANNVLILIPSGVNLSDSLLDNDDYSLFKLNTDSIVNKDASQNQETSGSTALSHGEKHDDPGFESSSIFTGRREARKFNFLRGMWAKKTSPLYLVNGTVCRFINNAPICTTLSTTGLLPTSGSGGGASRPASAVQGGGSSVQFNSPPTNQGTNQNQNRPRPAAILDDDSQDINVESIAPSNSTDDSRVVRVQQQQPAPNPPSMQTSRPVNYVANRRPLNLLTLRRPVRHHSSGGRANSNEAISDFKQQASRGGRSSV